MKGICKPLKYIFSGRDFPHFHDPPQGYGDGFQRASRRRCGGIGKKLSLFHAGRISNRHHNGTMPRGRFPNIVDEQQPGLTNDVRIGRTTLSLDEWRYLWTNDVISGRTTSGLDKQRKRI